MPSLLLEIQETVKEYVDIMAKISQVDVEVVDASLFRVAGTGMFQQHINQDMSDEGYTYQHVLRTGSLQVIYSPGDSPICQHCPRCSNCDEEIEIAMPIPAQGTTIGVIGLVGSSIQQRTRILRDKKMYLGLIEQIASFISAKAMEVLDQKKKESMLSALSCTISHMEQGILILGRNHTVTLSNQAAREQLRIEALDSLPVSLIQTGDRLNNQNEYLLSIGTETVHILGERYYPAQADDRYCEVLVFTCSRDLHKKMYTLTASVNTSTLVGSSAATNALRAEIQKVANSTSTVLLTGEMGVGKEVAATEIWRTGNRSQHQFVSLNCATVPENLIEADLFGYVKGAFPAASPDGRVGKFELANHGVIFLNEIGDMPLYLQTKLLRVLQDRRIVRIGSNQLIPIDVRVIAAANKDLKEMIADGKFREDLYYRLNVIPIHLLPLRRRLKDIPDLANLFASRYSSLFDKPRCRISPDCMKVLLHHPWYGNVRELENTVEFMVNMSDEEGILGINTLPRDFFADNSPAGKQSVLATAPEPADGEIIPLAELERQAVTHALELCGSSTQGKREAARRLGISLATLYRKADEFSL
ncbi:MAG: sigma-54 dependent transcriptional regulator [Oscillospiraceae bacterium]|nr:sigma-54 dependent transcriptional regulator [Oscillospiraceae bacterium]